MCQIIITRLVKLVILKYGACICRSELGHKIVICKEQRCSFLITGQSLNGLNEQLVANV